MITLPVLPSLPVTCITYYLYYYYLHYPYYLYSGFSIGSLGGVARSYRLPRLVANEARPRGGHALSGRVVDPASSVYLQLYGAEVVRLSEVVAEKGREPRQVKRSW